MSRAKAQQLRKSRWWQTKIQNAICHFCGKSLKPEQVTMDHLVPLAQGGKSVKGNVVVSCRPCNQKKSMQTPVEMILEKLSE